MVKSLYLNLDNFCVVVRRVSFVYVSVRVRESQVLFLAGKSKGCFYAPPYLDDYGETDQGLRYASISDISRTWLFLTLMWDQVLFCPFFRRGNPLHLCQERYRKIQKLWRQHSITEEIGHAQEANQTLVGIDWQHLWSHMMLSHTFAPPLTHKGTRTAELEVAKVSPRPLALPPPLSPSFWQWMNAWLFLFFGGRFFYSHFLLNMI